MTTLTDAAKTPLPVFTVEIRCSRQWGDAQQVSLDRLLHWSAHLAPELGIRLVDTIASTLNEILPGAMSPISESGARALDALGKDEQLPLIAACAIPEQAQ